jgi:hypothetical protein
MMQTPIISVRALILLERLATVSGLSFAQGDSVEVPDNARAKEYGKGWECNRPFNKRREKCALLERICSSDYITAARGSRPGMAVAG